MLLIPGATFCIRYDVSPAIQLSSGRRVLLLIKDRILEDLIVDHCPPHTTLPCQVATIKPLALQSRPSVTCSYGTHLAQRDYAIHITQFDS
jgi:hypothetical protein